MKSSNLFHLFFSRLMDKMIYLIMRRFFFFQTLLASHIDTFFPFYFFQLLEGWLGKSRLVFWCFYCLWHLFQAKQKIKTPSCMVEKVWLKCFIESVVNPTFWCVGSLSARCTCNILSLRLCFLQYVSYVKMINLPTTKLPGCMAFLKVFVKWKGNG